MTVSTLRPSSTTSNNGAVTQGGAGSATAHAVLSHDSDGSYVTYDMGEQSIVGLGDLTLPADAVIKSVGLRLRKAKATATNGYIDVLLRSSTATTAKVVGGSTLVNWGIQSTDTVITASTWTEFGTDVAVTHPPIEDADVDAAVLVLTNRTLTSGSPDLVVSEAYVDVTYIAQPVVTVTLPTGTVTNSSAPLVTWDQTLDADEPTSSHFQVKIFTDDQVTAGGFDPDTTPTEFDSGETATAFTDAGAWNSAAIGLGLDDDDYHAYVRTAVTVNGEQLWSDWDSEPFEIDLDRPGQPSLTVIPDSDNARVGLTLEGTSGAVDTDYFEVQRSDDGETTWLNLRTELGDGLVVGPDEISFYDYEAPNGVEVTYRARAQHDFAPGTSVSNWTDAIGIWSSGSWWLKHPTDPALNFEVGGEDSAGYSYPGHARAARQGVFQALGATNAIVVKDTRGPRTGTLVLRLDEDARKAELDTLLETESPLYVQVPAAHHDSDRWVAIGDSERERIVDKGWWEPTTETLAWTEVARPELAGAAGEVTVPEPEPEPEPSSIDLDSFNAGTNGTGTLSWTHTPTNDGQIIGAVVAVVQDHAGVANNDQINTVTIEGEVMSRLGAGTGTVPGDGWCALYFLGTDIPSGALDFSITVTGATAKKAASWLIYGSGDTNSDDSDYLPQANSTSATFNLTTSAETVVVGAAFVTDPDPTDIEVGTGYTNDTEHDFTNNCAIFFHRTDDPAAGTVSVTLTSPDAQQDYAIGAVAVRIGVAVPPGGPTVLREDLATVDDPTGGSNPNSLWRKVDSAFASGSFDFNWTSGDLQHQRLSASPDPHIAVGEVSPSTHYRRTIVSDVYLAGALSGSPTTLAVTADAAYPVPTAGTCSIAGQRAFRYTGRTGTFPNYTFTGLTWIDATPTTYPASTRVGIQSSFDSGVPNDSYRCQMQRWSSSPANTFYVFSPGTRRQIVFSTRFDTDSLPWSSASAQTRRSMVAQWKPAPSGGIGPIFSIRQYGDTDELNIRHDTGTETDLVDDIPFDPSVGWIRLMADITFAPTAADGRFQLFGDLDGDRLDYEDMVPLSEQVAVKSCGAAADAFGETSGFGLGPYCPMLVPAHWRDYANVQVIDPT